MTHDIPYFVIIAENIMAALNKQDRGVYYSRRRTIVKLIIEGYEIASVNDNEIVVHGALVGEDGRFQLDDPGLFQKVSAALKRECNLILTCD